MRRHPFPVVLLLLGLLGVFGCSDSSGPSGPPNGDPVPTTLSAVEGEGLQAPAGTILPMGPTVQLKDQNGQVMSDRIVTFQVMEGGGTAVIPSLATDSQGWARSMWILGTTAGSTQRLRASVGSLSVEFQAEVVQPVPGQKYSGRGGYADYYAGNLPLVLTAPHGGSLLPTEIPDRSWGTTGQDRNTVDLILRVRDAIYQRTGAYPHVIYSNLHRIKLDPNREIVEAAQDDPESERAWWEYHTFADRAGDVVEAAFGEGFYIDLHGHGHEIPRLELGYLLSATTLSLADEFLNSTNYVSGSSVKLLAGKPGATLVDIIRGPKALGTLLEARGLPAVPSQSQHSPGNDPYFNGGYSTVRHGSRDTGKVSGVQIECNFGGVRDTAENRQAFAEVLADALLAYFPAHFGMELAAAPLAIRSP